MTYISGLMSHPPKEREPRQFGGPADAFLGGIAIGIPAVLEFVPEDPTTRAALLGVAIGCFAGLVTRALRADHSQA
jgi:hypothetical protein